MMWRPALPRPAPVGRRSQHDAPMVVPRPGGTQFTQLCGVRKNLRKGVVQLRSKLDRLPNCVDRPLKHGDLVPVEPATLPVDQQVL